MQVKKGEVAFEQVNDEYQEPYYIVHFENEQWYPSPVKE
jgi:hypothetical protein